MDQKHREYCIKLGNPYYTQTDKQCKEMDSFTWNKDTANQANNYSENWAKNSKKFTN